VIDSGLNCSGKRRVGDSERRETDTQTERDTYRADDSIDVIPEVSSVNEVRGIAL
jgi:hypothetical protein